MHWIIKLIINYPRLCFLTVLITAATFFVKNHCVRKTYLDATERKNIGIELLRIVSCYMIIVIHLSGWVYRNSFETEEWVSGMIQQCLPRFAVPCFLMITGYYNLRKERLFSFCCQRLLPAILVPLVFWSLMHLVFYHYSQDLSWDDAVHKFINLPTTQVDGHLWYGYMLTRFYLLLPFMRFYKADRRHILAFIGIVLLAPSIIDMLLLFSGSNITSSLVHGWSSHIGLGELGLFALGYYLLSMRETGKVQLRVYVFAGIFMLGLGLMLTQTHILSGRAEEPVFSPFDYMRFPALLMGTSALLFFYGIDGMLTNLPLFLRKSILRCGKLTKGVYFSHILIARILEKQKMTPTHLLFHGNACVAGSWLDSAAVMIFALLICYIFSNIPILKKTI